MRNPRPTLASLSIGVLLASSALAARAGAQDMSPRVELHPVSVGLVDPAEPSPGAALLFDNSFTGTAGSLLSLDMTSRDAACSAGLEFYGFGRLPGASPANRCFADDYEITGMSFGMCSNLGPVGVGGSDVDFELWSSVDSSTPGPACQVPAGPSDLFADLGMPGSNAVGFTNCWFIAFDLEPENLPLFRGNGNGQLDGNGAQDSFAWSFTYNEPSPLGGTLYAGPWLAGDAASAPPGANTFGQPGVTDPNFLFPVGTGLGMPDQLFVDTGFDSGCGATTMGCLAAEPYNVGECCYTLGGSVQANMWFRLWGYPTRISDVVLENGGTQLSLTNKNILLCERDKIRWQLSPAITAWMDVNCPGYSKLRLTWTATNPTSDPNPLVVPLPSAGVDLTVLVTAGTGPYQYDLEVLDASDIVLHTIDPFVTVVDPDAVIYCTSKPSSLPGCTPSIALANPGILEGIHVLASPVPGGTNAGILFYSNGGALTPPVSSAFGLLCVQPGPDLFRVTPGVISGGTNGLCNGTYDVNFSDWVLGGMDPSLGVSSQVDAQIWYRDPANMGGSNTTNAVQFTLF